jgi:hypothetical protein
MVIEDFKFKAYRGTAGNVFRKQSPPIIVIWSIAISMVNIRGYTSFPNTPMLYFILPDVCP